MNITEMLLTPNPYSRPGTALKKVLKIAVHYVGNAGSTAAANRNYFESLKDKKNVYASSHYIIGLEGEVIRCVPESEIAYCTNQANSYSVSIENCHKKTDGKFSEATLRSLAELCAELCKRYKLNPLTDIIRHYDVTGKKCPLDWVNRPGDFERFKSDVKNLMEDVKVETVDEAVKLLCAIGVVGTPAYWYGAVKCVHYLDMLLVGAARRCKAEKQRDVMGFDEALAVLSEASVVRTPMYWAYAVKSVKYLDDLMIRMAERV